MQGTQDSSREPAAAFSLEDRLRDMITSHQQHHQSQHNRASTYPAGQQSLPPPYPSQNLRGPPPTYPQSIGHPQPPAQIQPPPGLADPSSFPRTAGPPQFDPRYQQHYTQGRPIQQPTWGPHGPPPPSPQPQQPRRGWNTPAPLAPPLPSLGHFPLGEENPEGKQRSRRSIPPYRRADQHRDQQHHRPEAGPPASGNSPTTIDRYDWRPARLPAAHYEQFFGEQAANLERVARVLLEKISPPEEETVAKNELLRVLQDICRKLVPTAELIPFGSLVSECQQT